MAGAIDFTSGLEFYPPNVAASRLASLSPIQLRWQGDTNATRSTTQYERGSDWNRVEIDRPI